MEGTNRTIAAGEGEEQEEEEEEEEGLGEFPAFSESGGGATAGTTLSTVTNEGSFLGATGVSGPFAAMRE